MFTQILQKIVDAVYSTFFYKDEWFEYMKNGHLTKLTTAFSRDQKEKIYV